MNSKPIVFIVDDDPAIRKSYRWLAESIGLKVQTYDSALQFLEDYEPGTPGCLVLDVRMPGMSGMDLQEKLQAEEKTIPIILVSGYGDIPMAVRAMQNGAVTFIEKPASDQVLLDTIQRAIALDEQNRREWAEYNQIARRKERLTKREEEVMNLVVEGNSSKEIADKLDVSFKTVEAHRAKIMRKMEAKSVPQLIRMCLVKPPT